MQQIVWNDLKNHIRWEDLSLPKEDDLYEILEVSPRASQEVIKRAYHALAAKYHPDKHTAERKPWAEEMMKRLNHAYETLSNPEARDAFDRSHGVKM